MTTNVYGGDEVGAIVFDVGSYSLRSGYAGEDSPKAEIPSYIATYLDEGDKENGGVETMETEDSSNISKSSRRKYLVDSCGIHVPKPDAEIVTYMKDGLIDNWDLFEKILDHAYAQYLQTESRYHPVLFSEAPWNNDRSKREKLIELAFEKYDAPAFYLVKSAVLSAFANGRSTGLVLDSGATTTSAVPVHDGYVLQNSIVRIPLAGDFITSQCKKMLEEQQVEIIPSYMIGSKEAVKDNDTPKWSKKPRLPVVGQSYHEYMVKEVLQDFQSAVVQVSDGLYDPDVVATMPMVHYEFPNGYNKDFGGERFRIAEPLFDTSALTGLEAAMGSMGVAQTVSMSANMCDVDLKPTLYNNVIVTGGNTLLQGFVERLNRDLSAKTPPSMRLKVVAASGPSERRFSSWIGGSILASLGNFQQMWISKQEYDEGGKSQVEKKCP
ncbi:unnamed protein product [Notodromas monacha]|uniref:Actin-like protein 6B n=1 Tax=Notodromas monacha TaxID=399045 RepID=A0A7R9BRL1_9CRUS|nr:unnamed protein product [Notodromas monacha]CAG0920060.1 unnamed protein product [Notodromas monacha]